jgi:hypothetical protein
MAMQRLPEDFEQCYNYRPLLVDCDSDSKEAPLNKSEPMG